MGRAAGREEGSKAPSARLACSVVCCRDDIVERTVFAQKMSVVFSLDQKVSATSVMNVHGIVLVRTVTLLL